MSLTLTQAIANLRTDLNDLDNTNYRWTDPVITRELDRAVACYSSVNPFIAVSQLATVAGSRIYSTPAAAWWIERVEYPASSSTPNYPRTYVPFRQIVSTAGTNQVELQITNTPADTSGIIEITYAGKHTLDGSGTTIPEQHHDALYLGAQAYLVEQYLSSVLDNFEWVDGQFRDKVDDTKSMAAWQAFHQYVNAQWERRIRQIETEVNPSSSVSSSWGDKPSRWDRL